MCSFIVVRGTCVMFDSITNNALLVRFPWYNSDNLILKYILCCVLLCLCTVMMFMHLKLSTILCMDRRLLFENSNYISKP